MVTSSTPYSTSSPIKQFLQLVNHKSNQCLLCSLKPDSQHFSSKLFFSKLSSMGIFIIINIIFSTITLLSNLVSRLLFNTTAYFLVIAIQGLKVPGEALQGAMEQVASLIKTCVEFLFEIIMEVISEIIGLVFDLVKEGVFGSVAATGAVAGGLVEKMKSAFDVVVEEIPAVVEGVMEMVTTMVTDLWNNYMEAQSYVTENA